jgi:hypothetical protein
MTSRVLDALKVLEGRRHERTDVALLPAVQAPPDAPPSPPVRHVCEPPLAEPTQPSPAQTEASSARRASRLAAEKMCLLPTVPLVANHYLELARRIGEQLASSYCTVLSFVRCDDAVEACFSMTELAQAFSLQSAGGVLLVDGDLRHGLLSKSVCSGGAGMIEAMAGTASWPQIVRATTTPRVDFVSSGDAQVPTFERPEFGWGALRPKYRAVLIGLSDTRAPETAWLAARCDAVYFVLSRPHTKRRSAIAALEVLRSRGANLLGCVVAED